VVDVSVAATRCWTCGRPSVNDLCIVCELRERAANNGFGAREELVGLINPDASPPPSREESESPPHRWKGIGGSRSDESTTTYAERTSTTYAERTSTTYAERQLEDWDAKPEVVKAPILGFRQLKVGCRSGASVRTT
jgi:hypothetical protein